MKKKPDLLSGKTSTIFFWYAIPTIMGMMAISSAFVIDGIFLGNVVGAQALAAVNLTIPFWGFTFSLSVILGVGGSVQCGRLLGANLLIMPDVIAYLKNYCWFLPFIFMGIGLTSFGRVNQAPELVFVAISIAEFVTLMVAGLMMYMFLSHSSHIR